MRIGIDVRNVGKNRTGDETVFFHLTRGLARLPKTGHEFFLFVDNRTPEELEVLAKRLEIVGREDFQFVNLKTGGKFRWNAWDLPRALRTYPVDVYHTQYITPFWVPKRTAVVTHIHDVSFRRYPALISATDRFFLARLIPRSLRQARAVVAVSEFTKDEIRACYGVSEEKIHVVLNALGDDFADYHPAEGDIARIREAYKLPEKFILYVGTLQPRKNLPVLVRAFADVRRRVPEVALVLAGNRSGHHFDSHIDAAIQETGTEEAVVFPGYIAQEDLPGVMRLASLFVFPSLYEGFGIPILEAMSQDVPVVASGIPVLREVGGNAAVYVDPSDLAALGESLYTTLTSPDIRLALVRDGQSQIRRFSWQESAARLLKVYESLA